MKSKEKLICGICGGTNVKTKFEEKAYYIDRCKCGAWRFNTDKHAGFPAIKKEYGYWISK